jgi:hypothetical protein
VGGRQQAGAGGPEREHEGQTGGRLPEVAEVVYARAGEAERGVADDQRGVAAAHAGEALAVRAETNSGCTPRAASSRRTSTAELREAASRCTRAIASSGQSATSTTLCTGAAAADADLGHDLPLGVRGVGGDRHEADVAQALLELARALGGQGGADLEQRLPSASRKLGAPAGSAASADERAARR